MFLCFFLSGCTENFNSKGILENVKHKFFTLIVPFFSFGILTIVVNMLNENSLVNIYLETVFLLRGGIRNTSVLGSGLWFLTCLFVINIIFSCVKK